MLALRSRGGISFLSQKSLLYRELGINLEFNDDPLVIPRGTRRFGCVLAQSINLRSQQGPVNVGRQV